MKDIFVNPDDYKPTLKAQMIVRRMESLRWFNFASCSIVEAASRRKLLAFIIDSAFHKVAGDKRQVKNGRHKR